MIRLDNVDKIYNNNVHALKNATLTIEKGDIFGIVGKSGAGKSTMLKLIGLLESPTSGELEILGRKITDTSSKEAMQIRRNVGTVFQGYNLLMQRDVRKNIAFPLEIAGENKAFIKDRCEELAEMVGLKDKLNSYPSQLSGGQKQRVAIARALAVNPKILLCDEPTSALDGFTTREILKLVKDINKKIGVTIVIITHETSVVKAICNKMAVLDDGFVAELGTTKEIFANPKAESTKLLLGIGEEEI